MTGTQSATQEGTAGNGYRWIGKNMKLVEDPRLLTGRGRYLDDVTLPNMAHAAVLRSPHAHARIKSIDTGKAKALPGVLLVMTGAEAAQQTGPLPCFANPPVAQYGIAVDRVRHVGEAVAAVVAEDRYIAEDALDLIDVEYEPLPVVIDPEEAIKSTGDAVLHPDRGSTNVALDRTLTFGPVDEDFAAADVVVRRRLRWPRSGAQPMETVGAVAQYDPGTGKFTIYANTSMYNYVGWLIAMSLKVAAPKVNIIPTLAGGSFGSKLFTHKVPILAATLARAVGRPVKYLEDRIDNITNCDNHGSDRIYDVELALKRDGTMLSLRMNVIDDYGAYLQFGVGHHGNALAQLPGSYRIKSAQVHLTAVMTNKCQQGAYRGFGSEVNNFVIERLVDAAAEQLGMDPVEIRRKNFIQPDQFPYKIPTGNLYDSGNYEAVLNEALKMADYEGWRKQQEEARKAGRYVGIGLATCPERSVFSSTEFWFWNEEPGFALTSSPESVGVKIDPTGKTLVTLYSPFWGNSPETVAVQVLAEQLTIDPADIEVNYSDTDQGLDATGPGGSRFTVMLAGALAGAAAEIKAKLFKVGAHMLEAAEADLELHDGQVSVRGAPDRSVSIADIAMQAHYFRLTLPADVNSGLAAHHTYDHPYTTLPNKDRTDMGVFYPIMAQMCHIPVVEVDIETGRVEFLKYVAVHDCGTVVNPMGLAGHVRGGTAQGIGTALYEQYYYDEDGQLLTANYADYLIPSLMEVPAEVEVGHVQTPSPYTEYGIKGGGEGGRMGAPAAVASAVEDALRPLGVKINELPLTPMRLRTLIRAAQQAQP
ncbi:MAG: xanthine dehydrogenase family protein molybdopterin-binding subunit [Ardenticatenaceae bacterium]|nr:xanthine dehydrogenase family protein molybdopterin-binding subunit [Ardenticatenaceae bacterium]